MFPPEKGDFQYPCWNGQFRVSLISVGYCRYGLMGTVGDLVRFCCSILFLVGISGRPKDGRAPTDAAATPIEPAGGGCVFLCNMRSAHSSPELVLLGNTLGLLGRNFKVFAGCCRGKPKLGDKLIFRLSRLLLRLGSQGCGSSAPVTLRRARRRFKRSREDNMFGVHPFGKVHQVHLRQNHVGVSCLNSFSRKEAVLVKRHSPTRF